MRACSACFRAKTWTANASPPESSPATCSFGHDFSSQTWPTTAWVDSLAGLLSIYEVADGEDAAEPHVCVQRDWGVFTLDDDAVAQFLRSAVPNHHLLVEGVKVRLRSLEDGHEIPDHLSSWATFSGEIRTTNRYFPRTVPDKAMLEEVLSESICQIDEDVDLFRGRIYEGAAPTQSEMGAPRPEITPPGRANPVGIPYLYLAYSPKTCIHEARATTLSTLAIGRFRPVRQLQALNLADIEPPDYFSLTEVESVEAQVSRVSFHRYLVALGEELKKPVRSADRVTDYIPTQYLCEMAKSIGLDGVLYKSSLDPDGRNLVLFDVDSAECLEDPQLAEVTSVKVAWREL